MASLIEKSAQLYEIAGRAISPASARRRNRRENCVDELALGLRSLARVPAFASINNLQPGWLDQSAARYRVGFRACVIIGLYPRRRVSDLIRM